MITTTLRNGVPMPMLGYGVFQVANDVCERCVLDALSVGCRLIDTAQAYGNEEAVGKAVKASGIAREDIFLTSKVWISNACYEKARASIDASLQRMGLDYLDLMLIHQPFGDYYGTYRALEEAYKAGKLRAIGVSNFYPDRFIDLCGFVEELPHVNQVETQVFQQQKTARQYMEKYGAQPQSWGPFAEGRNDFFSNETLADVASKHAKTVAQVALRFLIQENVVVIPKSVRRERMAENFDVFGFALDEADMAAIRALDTGSSLFFSHYDPETVERLISYGKSK